MNRTFLLPFLLVALLVAGIGCSSSSDEPADPDEPGNPPPTSLNVPEWVINVPSEPGQAFYGVGTDMFSRASQLDRAMKGADTSARRQIADTMKTTIQGATKRYARQVLTPDNQVHEEGLSQDVTRAITDWVLMGAQIVKHEMVRDDESGETTVYALARIGFDSVAENLHRETSQAVRQVQENAQEAFDELDRFLEEEHERNQPYSPPPADLDEAPADSGQ